MVHRYAFGYSVDNVPYLGDTYPNNHPKKGHEVAFSQQTSKILQLAYYQNHFIDFNQIWHDSRDHHILNVGGPNTCTATVSKC